MMLRLSSAKLVKNDVRESWYQRRGWEWVEVGVEEEEGEGEGDDATKM